MNITDVITRLTMLRAEFGDLEVFVMDRHSYEMENVTAVDVTVFHTPDDVLLEATIFY